MKRVTFKRRFLFELDSLRKRLGRDFEIETLAYVVEQMAAGKAVPSSLNPHPLHAD